MKNVIIKTKNLCKSFVCGKNVQNVLKNINLEIYEGDFTIIMGSSGSGKSTLLYSISSMDKPTGGVAELLGKKISEMGERETAELRSRDISFVFQSINLIPDLTAFENITYPAYLSLTKEQANKRAQEYLKRFGLLDERNKYPSEMSGGQQQRIAIARALVSNPKIIFGDEPTGALNSASGTQVLDMLTELNEEGQSIVMVTHDIKACARGSRLLFISDGRIAGDLNLGRYNPLEQIAREETVFNFLKKHHW